jgi:hypothetical protein
MNSPLQRSRHSTQHSTAQCISINTLAEIKAYNNFINDEDQPGEEENGGKKNSNEKKSFSRSSEDADAMPGVRKMDESESQDPENGSERSENRIIFTLCSRKSLWLFAAFFFGFYIQINLMITGE